MHCAPYVGFLTNVIHANGFHRDRIDPGLILIFCLRCTMIISIIRFWNVAPHRVRRLMKLLAI